VGGAIHVVLILMCTWLLCGCTSDRYHIKETSAASRLVDVVQNPGSRALVDSIKIALDSLRWRFDRFIVNNEQMRCDDQLVLFLFDSLSLSRAPDEQDIQWILPHSILSKSQGSCVGISALAFMLAEQNECDIQAVLLDEHMYLKVRLNDTTRNIEPIKHGTHLPDQWYAERYNLFYPDDFTLLRKEQFWGVFAFSLGNAFLGLGQPDDAVLLFQKAVQAYPKYGKAWGNLGVSLAAKGNIDAALEALQKARESGMGACEVDARRIPLLIAIAQYQHAWELVKNLYAENCYTEIDNAMIENAFTQITPTKADSLVAQQIGILFDE